MAEQLVKKEWTEPEVLVLVRSNPEEAALASCKGVAWTGPTTGDDCYYHYLCTDAIPS